VSYTSKSKDLIKRLAAVENQAAHQDASKERKAPPGWEPGVVWDGKKGSITTGTLSEPPKDWSDLLLARGLDPEIYEILSDTIKWTSYDGWKRDDPDSPAYSAICYSYKADIRMKVAYSAIPEDVYQAARKAKKPRKVPPTGEGHFVIALSDWQTGNMDGGGVDSQAEAIANLVDILPDHLADLRRAGNKIGHVLVAGLGDLVEGTCGHYPAQQYRIQLDRREQIKLVRRGIRDIVMELAKHADKVTVTAVGGNHGENRNAAGKAFTTTADNDDVAVFEQVAEILAVNPEAFGHVGFRLPLERLHTSIELSGHIVAFTHGHLSKPGPNAAQAVWNWWKEQSMGRAFPAIADADILVTGHYHHFNCKEQEGRALFVCPSLTQVGEYFTDAYGVKTRIGTLTFTVDPDGWNNLNILK
jgi:hypothetical protein